WTAMLLASTSRSNCTWLSLSNPPGALDSANVPSNRQRRAPWRASVPSSAMPTLFQPSAAMSTLAAFSFSCRRPCGPLSSLSCKSFRLMPSRLRLSTVMLSDACARTHHPSSTRHDKTRPTRNTRLGRRSEKWLDRRGTGMHCAKDQPNAKETAMTPTPDNAATSPRATILIAEDDGPSGLFLRTAFEDLGCRAALEIDGDAALARARTHRFDLLLLDCCMPGAGASRILSALRADPQAASAATPAIATSAELDAPARCQLR